jgi:putative alpha-1,2-mannosidase
MLKHRHQWPKLLSPEQRRGDFRIQYLGISVVRSLSTHVRIEALYSRNGRSFVPHDMATLVTLLGGPSTFVRRLDYLHDQGITYIGNEPAFLTVYQYHYAGRPAKSASRVHFYIPTFFSPTPAGLPGNDDSGTMGAFVAMSMMGLFPNPGQDVYFINPPFFKSVEIQSPVTNRTASVRVENFDPSYKNIYIQSATLNGKPYTKNWIDHSFFAEGKELVLTLGHNESSWGTHTQDVPPSLSTQSGSSSLEERWTAGVTPDSPRFQGRALRNEMHFDMST